MPRIDREKVKLLHGPYKAPPLRKGDRTTCLYRDREVIISGMSDARISWPLCRPLGKGRPSLLVEEELERKSSALFIALLGRLRADYPRAPDIHVILDNYRINDSKVTQAALQGFGGRIRLHFLPPYSPKENRIERVWEDLHANGTRNHTCRTMEALMAEVREYLWRRNRLRAGIERRQAG
jgi:transposase